jgi:hypothetical protein
MIIKIPRKGLRVYSCRYTNGIAHFNGCTDKTLPCATKKELCPIDNLPCNAEAYLLIKDKTCTTSPTAKSAGT